MSRHIVTYGYALSPQGSFLGGLQINGRLAHRDLERYVAHRFATARPRHLHIHRAVQQYKRRMSAMHAAYRAKTKGRR